MKINKKRIFIIIVLLFLVIKSINIVFRQPIKEVVQTWPLSTNPNGVRLRIPVGYIDSDVMWFEPLLEKDKPPKKPEDKTGIELFNAWWPTMAPVSQKLTIQHIRSMESQGNELLGIMAVSYQSEIARKNYPLLRKLLVALNSEFASNAIDDTYEHKKHIMEWLQTTPVSELGLVSSLIKPLALSL